jgi:hypothetical protein
MSCAVSEILESLVQNLHCMRSVLMLCINDMVGFGKRLCHMKYALNCLNTFSSNYVMQEFKEEA